MAGELSRRGLATIVVEAGPLITNPPGSHVRNRHPAESGLARYNEELRKALVFANEGAGAGPAFNDCKVIHAVGGMFAYWTCNCPTPHPAERAPWISADDWEDILARARRLLGVGFEFGSGSQRQERLIERVTAIVERPETGREVQPMPVAARRHGSLMRFASADMLLAAETGSNTVDLRPDLVCRKILHQNGRAEGVIVRSRHGIDDIVIGAEIVVVAAGIIGTPKLIAGSGIDAGPALGAYLFDHPTIGSRVVLQREILADVPADDPVFTVWIPYAGGKPWHNQICRFPNQSDHH